MSIKYHSLTWVAMRSKSGHAYKFYTGDAVYPFGYGLSYITFLLKKMYMHIQNDQY